MENKNFIYLALLIYKTLFYKFYACYASMPLVCKIELQESRAMKIRAMSNDVVQRAY